MSDLKLAYDALRAKQGHHNTLWNYYHGRQPLRWASKKVSEVFGADQADYVCNWCLPISDAVSNRLVLNGFQVSDNPEQTERLAALFESTGLALDADGLHQEASVTGEAFVIAWKDGDTVEAYQNDGRSVHLFYREDKPREKRFAAKWWGEGEHLRMTLYYSDRLEYYRSTKKASELADFDAKSWGKIDEAENPFGVVPVFRFAVNATGGGDLDNALSLQDIVNKHLSDLVVASEFTSFPQRWMISRADFPEKGLPISPSELWKVPPAEGEDQPVSMGQFQAADLDNFLKSMDHAAQSLAAITSTPRHLFWGQSGTPSGEAIAALEAPLIRKVQRYQHRLSATWRQLAAFLLTLDGQTIERESAIVPVFDDPRTAQPLTESMTLQNDVSSGIPLANALRDRGWTAEDLAQLEKDQKADEGKLELFQKLPAEPTA